MPLVVLVPRGPGQREDRYAHLLSGEVDIVAASLASSSATASTAARAGVDQAALEARVDALETELAELRRQVESWMSRPE